MTYDDDRNAVSDVQRALNAAGHTPPVPVNGVYDDTTAQAIRWLQTEGGGTVDGHVTDELLASLGVDPAKKGYAGAAAHTDVKAPPAPATPPPASKARPLTVLAVVGAGVALGAALGGVIGAALGAVVGLVGGAVIGRTGSHA